MAKAKAKAKSKKTTKKKTVRKTKGGVRVSVMQTFLHGPTRYTVGDSVTLPEDLVAEFEIQGWVCRDGENPPQGQAFKESVLAINKGRIGSSTTT